MTRKDSTFETDSLYLASFLSVSEFPLVNITRSGRFGVFHFGPKANGAKTLEAEVADYLGGRSMVEPLGFISAVRNLRAKVDNLRPEQEGGKR